MFVLQHSEALGVYVRQWVRARSSKSGALTRTHWRQWSPAFDWVVDQSKLNMFCSYTYILSPSGSSRRTMRPEYPCIIYTSKGKRRKTRLAWVRVGKNSLQGDIHKHSYKKTYFFRFVSQTNPTERPFVENVFLKRFQWMLIRKGLFENWQMKIDAMNVRIWAAVGEDNFSSLW